jgi:hypothetical protein
MRRTTIAERLSVKSNYGLRAIDGSIVTRCTDLII